MIEVDRNPSAGKLRWFAGLQVVFFALVAAQIYRRSGSVLAVLLIVGASLALAVIGFVQPAALRRVYVGWMLAVFPIGWVVSHAVLALIFYAVFTPLGLVMRLFGRDPLARRFETTATTYWMPRRVDSATESYFRQF